MPCFISGSRYNTRVRGGQVAVLAPHIHACLTIFSTHVHTFLDLTLVTPAPSLHRAPAAQSYPLIPRVPAGLSEPFVAACPSATAASLVINALWPSATAPVSPCTPPLPATATGSKKAASLIKESGGSALLQIVPLVLLPRSDEAIGKFVQSGSSNGSSSTSGGGAVRPHPLPLHVDLGDLAEVLEGARAEGFSLAGVCAVPLQQQQQGGGGPLGQRDLAKLLRLPTPQAQISATAAAANRTGATAAGVFVGSPVVVLALSRDNASAHLPMRMQQLVASAAAGSGGDSSATLQLQGGGQRLRGLAAAAGISAPAPASRAASEEVLLHFFDLLADSSGYSICSL